jgi:hypothetical protein
MKTAILLVLLLSGCAQYSALTLGVREVRSEVKKEEFRLAKAALCKYLDVETWFQEFGTSPEKLQGWIAICRSPLVITEIK